MDLLLADVVLSTEEQLVAMSPFVEEGLVQSLLIADEAVDEVAEEEEQEDGAGLSLHC